MIKIHLSKEVILKMIMEKFNIPNEKSFGPYRIHPQDAEITWEGSNEKD